MIIFLPISITNYQETRNVHIYTLYADCPNVTIFAVSHCHNDRLLLSKNTDAIRIPNMCYTDYCLRLIVWLGLNAFFHTHIVNTSRPNGIFALQCTCSNTQGILLLFYLARTLRWLSSYFGSCVTRCWCPCWIRIAVCVGQNAVRLT